MTVIEIVRGTVTVKEIVKVTITLIIISERDTEFSLAEYNRTRPFFFIIPCGHAGNLILVNTQLFIDASSYFT